MPTTTERLDTLETLVRQLQGYIRQGAGTPEGNVDGNVGDLFVRTDGGIGTTLYVKEASSGSNTGWAAK